MAKEEEVKEIEDKTSLVSTTEYELGFLLNPLIAPEGVEDFVNDKIRTKIEAGKGEILSSASPKMMKLAYLVRKSVDNKISTFRDGYFGSIKFKGIPELADSLEKDLLLIPEIVRMVIVKSSGKNQIPAKPFRRFNTKRPEVGATDKPKEEMTEENKEAIDKEIDEMLVAPTS